MAGSDIETVIHSQIQRMQIYDCPTSDSSLRCIAARVQFYCMVAHSDTVLNDRAHAALMEAPGANSRDALLRELLAWFKKEFFTWVDTIRCSECNGQTQAAGALQPTAADQQHGAGRVEAHKCTMCGTVNRFPRYNDPGMLLTTRRGRCGEWANCFVLCARALDFNVRYVYDFTDHVWAEVWSAAANRWLHCDSCENALDTPLMYEAGWGKKLTYVFAFERDNVVDVTWRYTASVADVLARRTHCSETAVVTLMAAVNSRAQHGQPATRILVRTSRMIGELARFVATAVPGALPPGEPAGGVHGGRLTGSLEWRTQRGELGTGDPADKGGAS